MDNRINPTFYINPPNGQRKEDWLDEHCEEMLLAPPDWPLPDESKALVCLVANPHFTAAGVVDDQRDYDAFADPNDLRFKAWFVVDRSALRELGYHNEN